MSAVYRIMSEYTDIIATLKQGEMPDEFWSRVQDAAEKSGVVMENVSAP